MFLSFSGRDRHAFIEPAPSPAGRQSSDRQTRPGRGIALPTGRQCSPHHPSGRRRSPRRRPRDECRCGRGSSDLGHAGVALDHGVLALRSRSARRRRRCGIRQPTVAGALNDAPVMRGDGRITQIAAQPPQARKGAILVRPGEPAIADDIRNRIAAIFRASAMANLRRSRE